MFKVGDFVRVRQGATTLKQWWGRMGWVMEVTPGRHYKVRFIDPFQESPMPDKLWKISEMSIEKVEVDDV